MEAKKPNKKILMFPWLAFGHISPYLELAKKLSKFNFQIFLCSSPINLNGIKSKLPLNSSIQLVELNLPSLPNLPPHMHTTNGLPLHLTSTLHKAFDLSAPDFHSILLNLNPRLLITEMLQPWAIRSASSLDIPVVSFHVASAATFSYFIHMFTNHDVELPFPELDARHTTRKSDDTPADESHVNTLYQLMQSMKLCTDVVLMNSFREIEGKYIDYLSVLMKKMIIPVGPLVEDVDGKRDWILEWLDKKELKSTVYVSFGSEYFLSKKDMEELGLGLEMSGANFIWVVRFPKGEEMGMREALPDGFIERVGERGIIVDRWAPQRKILNHSSVGAFVSHCGWSSVMEAVVDNVPIIALPVQLDQPINAKVAVAAEIAIEVEREVDGAIERERVANAIKQVLFEKRGRDFIQKGKEVCENLRIHQEQNIEACAVELDRLCES